MLKNPYNNLLFDHINGFEFFLIFWGEILSYLPLLQEGTAAEFPALRSSHNRPCFIHDYRLEVTNVIQTQQKSNTLFLFLYRYKIIDTTMCRPNYSCNQLRQTNLKTNWALKLVLSQVLTEVMKPRSKQQLFFYFGLPNL